MPRIKDIEAESLSADTKKIFHRYVTDYGPFKIRQKFFAQRPPGLRHIMGLLLELADEAMLPKRYLEIALVTVSKLNDCQYCIAHHGPRMTREGFDAEAFELTLRIALCGFFNRANDALQINMEDGIVEDLASVGVSLDTRSHK